MSGVERTDILIIGKNVVANQVVARLQQFLPKYKFKVVRSGAHEVADGSAESDDAIVEFDPLSNRVMLGSGSQVYCRVMILASSLEQKSDSTTNVIIQSGDAQLVQLNPMTYDKDRIQSLNLQNLCINVPSGPWPTELDYARVVDDLLEGLRGRASKLPSSSCLSVLLGPIYYEQQQYAREKMKLNFLRLSEFLKVEFLENSEIQKLNAEAKTVEVRRREAHIERDRSGVRFSYSQLPFTSLLYTPRFVASKLIRLRGISVKEDNPFRGCVLVDPVHDQTARCPHVFAIGEAVVPMRTTAEMPLIERIDRLLGSLKSFLSDQESISPQVADIPV